MPASTPTVPPAAGAIAPRRRDYRLPTVLVLVAVVASLGYTFSHLPGRGLDATAAAKPHPAAGLKELEASAGARQEMAESWPIELEADPKDMDASKARQVLSEAEAKLKARQYDAAIAALNQSLPLMQKYPESYVLIGRALEGKKDYAAARDFYRAAIDRDPYLPQAYWGFATASEGLNDLESALGAMRSYLHTEPDKDPNRLRIAQARSALWEWESRLGRGPWGPSKGIPPGFTAAELKRDGRGVAIKMPIQESRQDDGSMKYEIKSQDKQKIFPRP